MRAVIQDRYGPPEVLRVGEAEAGRCLPVDEMLVGVRASTVTRGDAMGVAHRGVPLRPPRHRHPAPEAHDVRLGSSPAASRRSGAAVDPVPPRATTCSALPPGSCAEYVAVRESGLGRAAALPGSAYEQAAAIPDGSLLALRLHAAGAAATGEEGARVRRRRARSERRRCSSSRTTSGRTGTAVCDTRDVEVVRSLGAREVIDRLREDFTKNGETYDVVATRSASTRSAAAGAR